MQKNLEQATQEFIENLRINHSSALTLRNYDVSLRILQGWLSHEGITDMRAITEETVMEFKIFLGYYRLPNGQKYNPRTIAGHISHVKRFFGYCLKQGDIRVDPTLNLEPPRYNNRIPKVIMSKEEVGRIMELADTSTAIGYRNRAIFETLYATGIRNSELRSLTLEDVDLQAGTVRILNGKGGTDRMVPLSNTACHIVKEYINNVRPVLAAMNIPYSRHAALSRSSERRNDQNNYLFLSKQGRQMTAYSVRKMIMVHIRRSGLSKRISAHTFRHSIATHLLENGMDIRYIQEFLGHKSLQSTQIYTRVSIVELKKMYKKCHPREHRY